MRKLGWSLGKGMMMMKGMSIRAVAVRWFWGGWNGGSQWTHWVGRLF